MGGGNTGGIMFGVESAFVENSQHGDRVSRLMKAGSHVKQGRASTPSCPRRIVVMKFNRLHYNWPIPNPHDIGTPPSRGTDRTWVVWSVSAGIARR